MTERAMTRTYFGTAWNFVPATDAIRAHWVPVDGTKVEVYLSDADNPLDMVCCVMADGRERMTQLPTGERATFAFAEGVRIALKEKWDE